MQACGCGPGACTTTSSWWPEDALAHSEAGALFADFHQGDPVQQVPACHTASASPHNGITKRVQANTLACPGCYNPCMQPASGESRPQLMLSVPSVVLIYQAIGEVKVGSTTYRSLANYTLTSSIIASVGAAASACQPVKGLPVCCNMTGCCAWPHH